MMSDSSEFTTPTDIVTPLMTPGVLTQLEAEDATEAAADIDRGSAEVITDKKVGKTFTGTVMSTSSTREYKYVQRKTKALAVLQSAGIVLAAFAVKASALKISNLVPAGRMQSIMLGLTFFLVVIFGLGGPYGVWYLQTNILAGAHMMSVDGKRTQTAIWQKEHQRFRITNLSRKSGTTPVYHLYRRANEMWVLTRDGSDWRVEVPALLRKNEATSVYLFTGLENPAQEDEKLAAATAKTRNIVIRMARSAMATGSQWVTRAETSADVQEKTLEVATAAGFSDPLKGADEAEVQAAMSVIRAIERTGSVNADEQKTEAEGDDVAPPPTETDAVVATAAAVISKSQDPNDPLTQKLAQAKQGLQDAQDDAEANPLPVANPPVLLAMITTRKTVGKTTRAAFGIRLRKKTSKIPSVITVDLGAERSAGLTPEDHVALLLAMRIARSSSGVSP